MIKTVALVAGREIREKLRDRAFLIFTAFMLLLPFVTGGLGALFGASTVTGGPGHETYTVGLVGKEASRLGAVIREQASKSGVEVRIERPASSDASKRGVSREELDAAVEGDGILLPEGQPPFELLDLLQTSAQRLATADALREAGVPDREVKGAVRVALEESPLHVREAGGGEKASARSGRSRRRRCFFYS